MRVLTFALMFAGCWSARVPECSFLCSPKGTCPLGLACGNDGYCHTDSNHDHCSVKDAGLDAPADLALGTCPLVQVGNARLNSVYGSGPTDVWAAGESGTLVHCASPRDCAPVPTGITTSLTRVWASSAHDVWATGEGGAIHCTGVDSCTPVTGTVGVSLPALWAADDHDVWLGGHDANGALVYFCTDPTTCTQFSTPYYPPAVVAGWGDASLGNTSQRAWVLETDSAAYCSRTPSWSCFSYIQITSGRLEALWVNPGASPEAWLVGSSPGAVFHCTAGSQTCDSNNLASAPVAFHDVWGRSAADLWIAGDSGVLVHNGSVVFQAGAGASLQSLRGTAANVWAVGARDAAGLVVECAGTTCAARDDCRSPGALLSVWVSDSGDGWAVGDQGALLSFRP